MLDLYLTSCMVLVKIKSNHALWRKPYKGYWMMCPSHSKGQPIPLLYRMHANGCAVATHSVTSMTVSLTNAQNLTADMQRLVLSCNRHSAIAVLLSWACICTKLLSCMITGYIFLLLISYIVYRPPVWLYTS